MKMNKKGILMPYVLIFTILSISVSIGLMFWIEGSKTEFNIGETQEKIISTYVDSMSDKYFSKNTLKNNGEDSISKILKNTGIKNPIFKDSYILWKKGNKECFPNDWIILKNVLIDDLTENNSNFEVFRTSEGIKLKGILYVNGNFEDQNYKINYSEVYETEILIEDFNFDDFITKVDKIEEISNLCSENKICWQNEFSNLNDFYLVKIDDKLFKFEFITPGLDGNITVKSAVDYETQLNIGEKELKC